MRLSSRKHMKYEDTYTQHVSFSCKRHLISQNDLLLGLVIVLAHNKHNIKAVLTFCEGNGRLAFGIEGSNTERIFMGFHRNGTWQLLFSSFKWRTFDQRFQASMFHSRDLVSQFNSKYEVFRKHDSDPTWVPMHLKSMVTQLFVQQIAQANNKETNAQHYWSFV